MKILKMTQTALAFALAWGILPAHAAVVGKVIAVAGEASAVRQGKEIGLTVGAPVESGDLLKLGEPGNLQVRFTDEAIVALRSNSQLRIDNYAFANKPEADSSVMSLIKGGMRTITGLIGRNSRSNYAVNTPTSTIGIRGTHYTLVQCDNDCRNNDGSTAANGTFGGVTDGRIAVTNDAGEREFGRNEFFFVAARNTLPEGLLTPPSFLRDRLEGQAKSPGKGAPAAAAAKEESKISATSADAAVATSTAQVTTTVTPQVAIDTSSTSQPAVLDTIVDTTPTTPPTAIGGDGVRVTATTGLAILHAVSQFGTSSSTMHHGVFTGGSGFSPESSTVTWDTQGYKREDCGSGCFVDRNLAGVSELGADAGVLTWLRWTGGPISAGGWYNNLNFTSENSGFGIVVGLPATSIPTSGSYTYSLLGATRPVFSDGIGGGLGVGSVKSGSVTVDFVNRTGSASLDLQFTGGNSNYALSLTGAALTSPYFSGSGTMKLVSGSIDVCPGGTCAASLKGFLAGSGASHLGLGYDVTASDGTNPFYINGVAGFKHETPTSTVLTSPSQCQSFPCTYGVGLATAGVYREQYSAATGSYDVLSADAESGTYTVTASSSSTAPAVNPADPLGGYSSSVLSVGTVTDSGSHAVANLHWGRYSYTVNEVTSTSSYMESGAGHYVQGDPLVNLPTAGIYTFSHVGGTRPTDQLGNVGTLNSGGSWTVDFASKTMGTASDVNWTVNGVTYNLSVPNQSWTLQTFTDSNPNSGFTVSGSQIPTLTSLNLSCSPSCTPATSPSSVSQVAPAFLGNNAEALGVGYTTNVIINNTNHVTGHVQAYKR